VHGVPDDPEVDALFDLPVGEFVAARDRLAKDRRAAGDRSGAGEIKALRRPTVVAWALNQLARRHRDDLAALLEAGRVVAEAQREALAGDASSLREADRRRRELVTGLAGSAAELVGGARSHLDEIEAGLHAASLDPDGLGATLAEGRLSAAPSAGGGFDPAMAAWGVGASPARPRPAPAPAEPAPAGARQEPEPEAQVALAAERAAAETRARRLAEARERVSRRRRAARDAETLRDELERELIRLTARVEDARVRVEDTRRALEEAERRLARVEGQEEPE
jgi:hypothetical protein